LVELYIFHSSATILYLITPESEISVDTPHDCMKGNESFSLTVGALGLLSVVHAHIMPIQAAIKHPVNDLVIRVRRFVFG
jgi:hypothetical protein